MLFLPFLSYFTFFSPAKTEYRRIILHLLFTSVQTAVFSVFFIAQNMLPTSSTEICSSCSDLAFIAYSKMASFKDSILSSNSETICAHSFQFPAYIFRRVSFKLIINFMLQTRPKVHRDRPDLYLYFRIYNAVRQKIGTDTSI